MTRLNKAFDSIAGDILYHRDCFQILITDSSTKCSSASVKHTSHLDILDDIVRELRSKIDRGCAVGSHMFICVGMREQRFPCG